jgi:hypothetical protein
MDILLQIKVQINNVNDGVFNSDQNFKMSITDVPLDEIDNMTPDILERHAWIAISTAYNYSLAIPQEMILLSPDIPSLKECANKAFKGTDILSMKYKKG